LARHSGNARGLCRSSQKCEGKRDHDTVDTEPVEEIGRNSVILSTIPRMTACSSVIAKFQLASKTLVFVATAHMLPLA
jgi:hypothetical protein